MAGEPRAEYAPTYPLIELTSETPLQEIFDVCVRHLHAQGRPALMVVPVVGVTQCANRSGSLACAAGAFISDDHLAKWDLSARATYGLFENEIKEDQLALIQALQQCHDLSATYGDGTTFSAHAVTAMERARKDGLLAAVLGNPDLAPEWALLCRRGLYDVARSFRLSANAVTAWGRA